MIDEILRFDAGAGLAIAAGTQVGRRYPANYDVLHADARLVVVADGMGDGEGSATAGRTAVDTMAAALAGVPATPARLRAAVAEAQSRVRAAGRRLGVLTGCTLTAFVPGADGDAWLVQVGDSRAYRLRDGLLELLTTDHTAAWLGAVNGWWPADSPAAARARYQLHRYVGHPGDPEPDILNVSLRPGDVYCLCTDGVTDQVPYHRLAERLAAADPRDAVAGVLADTLAAGGHDNATLAVVGVS